MAKHGGKSPFLDEALADWLINHNGYLQASAWAGINVCEIISTSNEISIVVSEEDVHRAFAILMGLKKK